MAKLLGIKVPGIVVSILVAIVAIMLVERIPFLRQLVKGA